MDDVDKDYWSNLIREALAEEPAPVNDPNADAAALDHIAAALHG